MRLLPIDIERLDIPHRIRRGIPHPAPFPVELPRRLIELYTYPGDLVVDPFAGSGTTGVAAIQTGRRFAGYEILPEYAAAANARISDNSRQLAAGLTAVSPAVVPDQQRLAGIVGGWQ